ncbi:MAG: tail fiber domain-containing protein [Flavobacteriales bacterium]|nr:MAG: tail fiber domain-containing protein [Flavobacteriales bacterium]
MNNLFWSTQPVWTTGGRVVGVRGFADGNTTAGLAGTRGVWGIAINADASGGPGYAGWFDGHVNIQGGSLYLNQIFALSDAGLKDNVQPFSGGAALIAQFEPKSYTFNTQLHPELGLPIAAQVGLVAQDVEQVRPELVSEIWHDAVLDSLGNEISPAYALKGVNYMVIIPILISNAKEQQSRIDYLEQQVASCCALDDGTRMLQGAGFGYIDINRQPDATASAPLAENALVVIPNPFQDNPTISYRIGTSGRAQLRVADGQGRVMGTLMDAGMQAGQHTMVWNTAGMAAGTYWLTLTLDGERITTQAVMVD